MTQFEDVGHGQTVEELRGKNGATEGRIVYQSDELMKGQRDVWIEHGEEIYRLRLTSSGKLYLTK
jgi:hemin uptake protein HemP